MINSKKLIDEILLEEDEEKDNIYLGKSSSDDTIITWSVDDNTDEIISQPQQQEDEDSDIQLRGNDDSIITILVDLQHNIDVLFQLVNNSECTFETNNVFSGLLSASLLEFNQQLVENIDMVNRLINSKTKEVLISIPLN